MGRSMTASELREEDDLPTLRQSGSWSIAGGLCAALVSRLSRAAEAKDGSKDPRTGKLKYPGIQLDPAGAELCRTMAVEAAGLAPEFAQRSIDPRVEAARQEREKPLLLPRVMDLRRRAEAILLPMGVTTDGKRF